MRRLPAEWEKQSGVVVAFPHKNTDWKPYIKKIEEFYIKLIVEITKREPCFVLCDSKKRVSTKLPKNPNIKYIELPTNDTWTRDYLGIGIEDGDKKEILDFGFNGWGLKYPANFDNQVTKRAYEKNMFNKDCKLIQMDMILEGGSIESDGVGTIITTSRCLLEKNRNPHLSKEEIENKLKKYLGAKRIIWIENGFLEGDDTDSHVDMLVRFANEDTLLYTEPRYDGSKEYDSLMKLKEEILSLKKLDGSKYKVVDLPAPGTLVYEGKKLPATYLNFLIINDAVLVPIYHEVKVNDDIAIEVFKSIFKDREVVPIDASVLIREGGSIHCATMNYKEGFLT